MSAQRRWLRYPAVFGVGYDGFIVHDEWGAAPSMTLADLREESCLFLIGEPGLGKTTALRAEHDAMAARGALTDFVDLGSTQEERRLRELIFESDAWREWIRGDGVLHLFLDGFDEARARVRTAPDVLRELLAAPVDRLRVRVTCRSADRHSGLEADLAQNFNVDQAVYELSPLDAEEVAEFAASSAVDGGAFVAEVIARGVQPLAMIPMTLKMLLRFAQRGEELPRDRVSLYRDAIRVLCVEHDEDRQHLIEGGLSLGQRVAVVTSIAGGTLLSGRTSIRLDDDLGDRDAASSDEVAGGTATERLAVDREFSVASSHVKEVLGYALFSARAEGRAGFVQPTLGEFLAASFLADGSFELDQIDDLIFAETANGRRVIPQLAEVAVWLSQMRPDFRERLLDRDPSVLLRVDPVGLAESERSVMVDALFRAVAVGELDRWDRRVLANLPALAHAGLAAQVARALRTDDGTRRVRQMACALVRATGLREVAEDLAILAFDPRARRGDRVEAIEALGHVAVDDYAAQLRDLARNPPTEDDDDELQGTALCLLWPRHLGITETLQSLHPPKRREFIGAYRRFYAREFPATLTSSQLADVLTWATANPQPSARRLPDEVIDVALRRALDKLNDPGILLAVTNAVAQRLKGHRHSLLGSATSDNPRRDLIAPTQDRRLLLDALASHVGSGNVSPVAVVLSQPALIGDEDIDWLIAQQRSAITERKVGFARLIDSMLMRNVDAMAVLEAAHQDEVLLAIVGPRFEAVPLDSEYARMMREARELDVADAGDPDYERRVVDNVTDALDAFEGGEVAGYWRAMACVEADPSNVGDAIFISRWDALPGWHLLDETSRNRIHALASEYLRAAEPEPHSWFGTGTVWRPAWAGYRALRDIVERSGPDAIESVLWEKWGPIIVGWPTQGDGEHACNRRLLATLVAKAPTSAADWIGRALDQDIKEHGHAFVLSRLPGAARDDDDDAAVLDRLEFVWSREIENALLRRGRHRRIPPAARVEVLAFLVRHGSAQAWSHASRLVNRGALTAHGGTRRELAIEAAAMLLAEDPTRAWPRVWALMRGDAEFGAAVIGKLAVGRERDIAGRLNANAAADLWEWLLARFPPQDDGHKLGAHYVTERQDIGMWRDRVVSSLRDRATARGVEALKRLADAHPDQAYLMAFVHEAAEQTSRRTWIPPPPATVIAMAENGRRRWIKSASDLRRVLVRALESLDELFRDETRVAAVWNDNPVTPKTENALSDVIKNHFDDTLATRGIIAGRELQVRPHPRGRMGEAIDLLVQAIAGPEVAGADTVATCVEVKCSWHKDVHTALESQLVARYLRAPAQADGIYVVGHFDSDLWDANDSARRARARRRNARELRTALAQQATDVSSRESVRVDAVVLNCTRSSRKGGRGANGGGAQT